MANPLLTPILDDSLRSIQFFNGRLLSAKDLSQEQSTNREAHARLGRVMGEGVARGLEVSRPTDPSQAGEPVVIVDPGLAINRAGGTLLLKERTAVSLLRASSTNGNGSAKTAFGDCEPAQAGVYVAGAGLYVLTLAPAEGSGSAAPVGGLGNTSATCDTRDRIAGVQFNAIQLPVPANILADVNRLRNRVAYLCFGVTALPALSNNPFGPLPETYGLLDDLRPTELTDCEVPLALLYWTAGGIQFVDMWAVRRRVVTLAPTERWGRWTGNRRLSEGEAMILQFQDHLQALISPNSNLTLVNAADHFDYLPPAGLLPTTGPGAEKINLNTFFNPRPHREPEFIDSSLLYPLLKQAAGYAPLDLATGEMVWLYQPWQNEEAGDEAATTYVIFTSPHVPYQGPARFDVARWDYSNYAWL